MLTLCTQFRVRRPQHLFLSLCSSLLCTKFLIWCLHYPNVLSYHLVFCDWLISWSLPSFIKDVNTWFKIFSTQGHGSLEHLGFAFTLVTKVTVATWIWRSHSPFPPTFSLTPFVPPHWFFSYGKLLEALYASVTFLCVSYVFVPFLFNSNSTFYYFNHPCSKFPDLCPVVHLFPFHKVHPFRG